MINKRGVRVRSLPSAEAPLLIAQSMFYRDNNAYVIVPFV